MPVSARATRPAVASPAGTVGGGRYVPRMVDHPAERYRWMRTSEIAGAATVTVCTGLDEPEVLLAFGAVPGLPEPLEESWDDSDPWVMTLPVSDGVVLAVEATGWQGSREPTLEYASSNGLAASMHWNANAVTRFGVARGGEVRARLEPGAGPPPPCDDPDVTAALAGLDFSDRAHRAYELGMVAVERLTGHRFGEADLAELVRRDVAHRVLPWREPHHPEERLADGSRRWGGYRALGPDTDRLAFLPGPVLAELAWAGARAVAERTGLLADEPAAAESLAGRRFTPAAELLARGSTLSDGRHVVGWRALHHATNPDPLAAALRVLDEVGRVLGEDGLARAREVVRRGG
jgi:hypothetical protein